MKQRYQKLKRLKIDLNSCVDLVCDDYTGKQYISKKVFKDASPLVIHQFRTEVDVLSSLHTPYIPELVDVQESESEMTLIETWIDGVQLDQWVKMHCFLKLGFRKRWILAIYKCLEQVHQLDYVYVDLKPQNLFVGQGQIFLIDFNSCIHSDATHIASASSFNYLQRENDVPFRLDTLAMYRLIRWLYPKNILLCLMRKTSFEKSRKSFCRLIWFERLVFIFLFICLSLSIITTCTLNQKDPLERYLKNHRKEDFPAAYQFCKNENPEDALYLWIENEWLDTSLLKDKKMAAFFMQEAVDSNNPEICAYFLEHIPSSILNQQMNLTFTLYQKSAKYQNRSGYRPMRTPCERQMI